MESLGLHSTRERHQKTLLENNTQWMYIVCVQWTLLYKSFLDWQKYSQYFNAHLWAPTLTPKYIPYRISFQRPYGFCTEPAFLRTGLRTGLRTRPHRSVPTDPVLGLFSRSGRCWACLSTSMSFIFPIETAWCSKDAKIAPSSRKSSPAKANWKAIST